MQVFFSNNIVGQNIIVDGQEHIHLSKVLRKDVDDIVHICNGNGLMLEARIVSISKKQTALVQVKVVRDLKSNPNKLILAVAPTKQMDRYEWMIEKCTEIGIAKIIPFYSQHSERRRLKLERLKLIATSAMKQSKALFLPEIAEPLSFNHFVQSNLPKQKFIAYMDESTVQLKELKNLVDKTQEVLIAIGPEGGFSGLEVEEAKKNGFSSISLGSKRLRTETAAIFCAAAYELL